MVEDFEGDAYSPIDAVGFVDPQCSHSPTKRGRGKQAAKSGKREHNKQVAKSLNGAKTEAMNLDGMVQIATDHVKFMVRHGQSSYEVDICHTLSCSCPDRRLCNCKHILWVLLHILNVQENDPLVQERRPGKDTLCKILSTPSCQSYLKQQSSQRMGQQASHPPAQTVITTSSQIAMLSSTQPVANTSTRPVTNTSAQVLLSTQPVIGTSTPIMTHPSNQPVTNTSTHPVTNTSTHPMPNTSTQPLSSTQRVIIPSTPTTPQNSTNLHTSSQPLINMSATQPPLHPLTQTIGPPSSQPLPRPWPIQDTTY